MLKPTVGRIVHFHLSDGEVRPAIIVRVWSDTCVQLQVFTDGYNDNDVLRSMQRIGSGDAPNVLWATSSEHGTDAHQWSWPQRSE